MNRRERENPIVGPGHSWVRDLLRVVGPAVLGVGLLLIVVGVGSFFSTFNSFGTGNFGPPKYFWCAFVGMPVLFVGGVLCMGGYSAVVHRYMAGEMAPVAKDTFNYMAHGTRDGVRDLASALGEGIAAGVAGTREHSTEGEAACPTCGATSPVGAQFCSGCGASFLAASCSSCGGPLVAGAKFCHRCGAPSRSSEIA